MSIALEELLNQTEIAYMIRLLAAALCGGIIGFERKNRLKDAGVRTHLIVSLGSALMMIVSKYGFFDVVVFDSISLDASRIAANIVSGVGFLGAGIIFVRGMTVSGLTTAAGIWATSGVGMAIGAGMYTMGGFSTLLIVVVQILLHKHFKVLQPAVGEQLLLRLADDPNALSGLRRQIAELSIEILSFKVERNDRDLDVELSLKLPDKVMRNQLLDLLEQNPSVQSIEL